MIEGDRPSCPRGCRCRMHRHGNYWRYARPCGAERFPVQRYWCSECGLSVSVLPPGRLPYRSVPSQRLEGFLDEQAEVSSGLDPPPEELEAGCLRRAWARFQTRVPRLEEALGLLLSGVGNSASALWKQMRLAKTTLEGILKYLAQGHKSSLLGDYLCLSLPA